MALGIFIAGITLIILALSYDYYRFLQMRKRMQHSITSCDMDLSEMRILNNNLQHEVSELKSQLKNTFVDPVTELLGWQLFEDRVQQALRESERHQFTMGLAMVDIDEFKTINDALGYEIGDMVLKEVASRLNECVREVDNVSRYTKDTFVIMLTQLAKPETAAIVAQRILQMLALPIQAGEGEIHLTACIGIALYPQDAKDAQTLLSRADHALHLAKTKGRHICQFYEEKMQNQSMRDLQFANVLSREEYFSTFSLRFQPIFYGADQELFCLEASLLWQHNEMGDIKQDELFSYAERHRKQNALSIWLLGRLCEEYKKLAANSKKPLMFAIPLSIKQLEHAHFIYEISQVLQQSEIKPEQLLIELETHGSELSFDILEKAFNMLHYLGVKMALNHFGANSLSLRYLHAMKVHYLKLDSIFIDDMPHNPESRKLLKAMNDFACNLSMQMIASGVMDKSQVDVLLASGVNLMQGDLFCKPLSLPEMEVKLPQIET